MKYEFSVGTKFIVGDSKITYSISHLSERLAIVSWFDHWGKSKSLEYNPSDVYKNFKRGHWKINIKQERKEKINKINKIFNK